MFQNFEVSSNPATGAPRVAKLREELNRLQLDGFLVPRADEHQGEYVPLRAQRLGWLTGFTGTAGAALILKTKAYVFVDGRYTLQVRVQTDPAVFDIESLVDNPPATWLEKNGKRLVIGFDPWLHTIAETRALKAALEAQGGKLVPVQDNLVDLIWTDQPAAPLEPVTIQPLQYAGQEPRAKLNTLSVAVENSGATATILTDPASIAWAFNIRGRDVSNTPLPLSFALIAADGQHILFIDKRKLPIETEAYLTQLTKIVAPNLMESTLAQLAGKGASFMLDPALAAEKLRMIIADANGTVIEGTDPARLPRAMKNKAELDGSRAAHERDGVAMVKFFSWLDNQPAGSVDEISAAQQLETSRRTVGEMFQKPLEDLSFDSISGAGPDGAIIHYRVNTDTNRMLKDGELYLIDSGAQYRDGTTDITRTVAIGEVSAFEKKTFTLVLKGVIALSRLRFPVGTRGQDIDAFARAALWQHGFDYAHGTGHGVGSYLAVHEGPQSISKRGAQELKSGMILSNEPGYYRPGEFGIRLENLIIVKEPEVINGGDIAMHSFETLTFCPIDRRLIDVSLLNADELSWLNDYHAQTRDKLLPHCSKDEKSWLIAATEAL
ncbi:aminopeptidase P family protein [Pseudochrobactrum sp. sp1633]|uniref:aminopeptidase P family protein n=1 Tax=Pseudochrobactrum sp. sp1633 TaxID=3036706 RepID=UPI0025A53F4B|nr:aminopeptidase P family protein [Pseudochrobactrum sp. sp1633]MDM8345441.1 aminopeptidase P family protein [Pseudochrobactrum sp. sp1633]HWD13068.1 aminopeptidase P family protein [Pseudochrobactrum sp.]